MRIASVRIARRVGIPCGGHARTEGALHHAPAQFAVYSDYPRQRDGGAHRQRQAIQIAVSNNKVKERYSGLLPRLRGDVVDDGRLF
jgi:hypothetical protein